MYNKPSRAYAATVAAFLFLTAGPASGEGIPYENEYAIGVDVSFVKQRVDRGQQYQDGGDVKHPLTIFQDHGYNWGRIQLCNDPVDRLPQTLDYVIEAGQELKERGMHFLLNLMFSNGWANPTFQPMPSEWVDLTHEERVEAVYEFCRDSVAALRDAGAMPDMVQVGNEIGNGFLWPDGRLYPFQDQCQ
jgi:arabinogalactan endo-1,4-beta-galactosidase